MNCIDCGDKNIYCKKRSLCRLCYQKLAKIGGISREIDLSIPTINKYENVAELDFVNKFFNHKNWLYQPASFRLPSSPRCLYTPDFYDAERNCFIEVVGTRQAFHANKDKYHLFRKIFPLIKFEIRKSTGDILDESNERMQWESAIHEDQ